MRHLLWRLSLFSRGPFQLDHFRPPFRLELFRSEERVADSSFLRFVRLHSTHAGASVMSFITPPKAGRTIRDIDHPFGIRSRRGKVADELIGDPIQSCSRFPPLPAPGGGNTLQARLPHQLGNAMFATPFALLAQPLPNLGASIHASTLRMKSTNGRGQPLTVLRPGTRKTALPGIIPTGGDLQQGTHQTHRKHGATTLNDDIPHREVLAKNAAASCKTSRSRVTGLIRVSGWQVLGHEASPFRERLSSLAASPPDTSAPTWPHSSQNSLPLG